MIGRCTVCDFDVGILNLKKGRCTKCFKNDDNSNVITHNDNYRVAGLRELLFSAKGKVRKGQFWIIMVSLFVLSAVIQIPLGFQTFFPQTTILLMTLPISIVIFWMYIVTFMKRCRDIGKPRWLWLLLLIPLVNLLALLYVGLSSSLESSDGE